MGATDMFYRLFWCFSGATSTSASQSTGSQHHSLVVATPSGPTSCWLGFLSGSSNQRGTTTRIGNDTAEIPSNPGTSTRLSTHKSKIRKKLFPLTQRRADADDFKVDVHLIKTVWYEIA